MSSSERKLISIVVPAKNEQDNMRRAHEEITAAMADGTGLDRFQRVFPERFYDVGIAEQHAVTFAAGLASEGLKLYALQPESRDLETIFGEISAQEGSTAV